MVGWVEKISWGDKQELGEVKDKANGLLWSIDRKIERRSKNEAGVAKWASAPRGANTKVLDSIPRFSRCIRFILLLQTIKFNNLFIFSRYIGYISWIAVLQFDLWMELFFIDKKQFWNKHILIIILNKQFYLKEQKNH